MLSLAVGSKTFHSVVFQSGLVAALILCHPCIFLEITVFLDSALPPHFAHYLWL